MKFGIGQSVRRTEDLRLVTGQGQYTDDLRFESQTFVAFLRMYYLERSCSMQVRALSGGVKLNWPNQGVPEKTAGQGAYAFDGMIGGLAWPALLRKLDRVDPSYKN